MIFSLLTCKILATTIGNWCNLFSSLLELGAFARFQTWGWGLLSFTVDDDAPLWLSAVAMTLRLGERARFQASFWPGRVLVVESLSRGWWESLELVEKDWLWMVRYLQVKDNLWLVSVVPLSLQTCYPHEFEPWQMVEGNRMEIPCIQKETFFGCGSAQPSWNNQSRVLTMQAGCLCMEHLGGITGLSISNNKTIHLY